MSQDYLFGDSRFAVGMVGGKKVIVKTEIYGVGGCTIVTIDGKEMRFKYRKDALEYLRNYKDNRQ